LTQPFKNYKFHGGKRREKGKRKNLLERGGGKIQKDRIVRREGPERSEKRHEGKRARQAEEEYYTVLKKKKRKSGEH